MNFRLGLGRASAWLSVVSAAVVLAACGANTVVNYEDVGEDNWAPEISWGKDVESEPDGGGGGDKDGLFPDDTGFEGIRYQIIPLHDPVVTLVAEGHMSIRAKVLDYATNSPAALYPVTLEIIESEPVCDTAPPCGRIMAKEVNTDNTGTISVTFEAGSKGPQRYLIQMSGEQANPETVEVEVSPIPTGNLKVKFNYSGEVALHDIHVRLTKGYKSCMQFAPTNPWGSDIVWDKVVGGVSSSPTVEALDLSPTYQVWATALGPTGHLAGAGCIDAVHILPSDQGATEVTLNLFLLTLNPAGTYDTINNFDFTDAIPEGQVGSIINLIIDVFTDPGKVIIDLIKQLVYQYVGTWVTDIVFGLFEDALGDLVTDWLLNNSPDFIQDFFVIGQDLIQIVTNLEIQSKLKMSKLGSDYSVLGQQSWIGINLYWKLGCDKDDPNYAECGKHPFSMEDLETGDFPMDLIAGEYTAMISNYDRLTIDTHKIELNYGKLILFVINKMLLPAISNFNSLTDLLYSIIDCAAIADGFVGDILGNIGIDKAQFESFCNNAETMLLGPIEGMIGGLALDSRLRVHGKCRLLDENDDLNVDKLTDGQWWGYIEIDNEQGNEFQGTFHGERDN